MFFSSSLLKKYWRRIILAFPDKVSPKSVSFFLQSQYVEKKKSTTTTFSYVLTLFQEVLARPNGIFPQVFRGLAMLFQKIFATNLDFIKNLYWEAINKWVKSAKLLSSVFIARSSSYRKRKSAFC